MPWKLESIKPSTRATKKLMATFFDNTTEKRKTVHFGAKGYQDFTTIENKDDAIETRRKYWKRHAKDLLTNDPTAAGYLSLYILWGMTQSIDANVRDYKKKFNL